MGKSRKENRSLIKFLNNTMEAHIKLTHSKRISPFNRGDSLRMPFYKMISKKHWRLDQRHALARLE